MREEFCDHRSNSRGTVIAGFEITRIYQVGVYLFSDGFQGKTISIVSLIRRDL